MSNVPTELRFAENHTWVRTQANGDLEIGITDFAQQALADLVSVELPRPGRVLKQDEAFAVLESTKSASDVNVPVAGVVTETNQQLPGAPETLNSDAYGSWLIRIRPDPGALAAAKLLSPDQYRKKLAAEESK
jgi:glycine cleavage system H protein